MHAKKFGSNNCFQHWKRLSSRMRGESFFIFLRQIALSKREDISVEMVSFEANETNNISQANL